MPGIRQRLGGNALSVRSPRGQPKAQAHVPDTPGTEEGEGGPEDEEQDGAAQGARSRPCGYARESFSTIGGFLRQYIAEKAKHQAAAKEAAVGRVDGVQGVLDALSLQATRAKVQRMMRGEQQSAQPFQMPESPAVSPGDSHTRKQRSGRARCGPVGQPRAVRNRKGGWSMSLRHSPPPPPWRLPPIGRCPDVFLVDLDSGTPILGRNRSLLRRKRPQRRAAPLPRPASRQCESSEDEEFTAAAANMAAARRAAPASRRKSGSRSPRSTIRGRGYLAHQLASMLLPSPHAPSGCPWRRSEDWTPEPCCESLRSPSPEPVAQSGPVSSVQRQSSADRRVADWVWRELEAFESKHSAVTRDQEAAAEGTARAVGQLKTGRVMQLIKLQRTPLTVLFRDVSPEKVQRCYTVACGGLDGWLTPETFSAFLRRLLHPEPPLPEDAVRRIFRIVDVSGDGRVDFVEFVSTLFFLVAPKAAQRTLRQLFWCFESLAHGKVQKRLLEPDSVEAAVRNGQGRQEHLRCSSASPDQLLKWRRWAEGLQEEAKELGDDDVLGLRELTVLIFFNAELCRGLQALAI